MDERRQRIERRAYEIWEREGRPDGKEAEHWAMAEQEIEIEALGADLAGSGDMLSSMAPEPPATPAKGGAMPAGGAGAKTSGDKAARGSRTSADASEARFVTGTEKSFDVGGGKAAQAPMADPGEAEEAAGVHRNPEEEL